MFDYISTPSDAAVRSLQYRGKWDSAQYLDPDVKTSKRENTFLKIIEVRKPHRANMNIDLG